MVQSFWKIVFHFLAKVIMPLPYSLAIALLGIYPTDLKTHPQKNLYINLHSNFVIMKNYKQPRCPSGGDWLHKLWHIHAMEYYSATERNKLLICAITWWKLQGILLREKRPIPKGYTIGFCPHNILEMIKLWKWRTDEWLPGVRNEGCSIAAGCGYKTATQGILELMDYSVLDSVKVTNLAVILSNSFVRCHYPGS